MQIAILRFWSQSLTIMRFDNEIIQTINYSNTYWVPTCCVDNCFVNVIFVKVICSHPWHYIMHLILVKSCFSFLEDAYLARLIREGNDPVVKI